MASKVIESGFYSKDNLKLQNVFKNGDQKQDGLIEYVFAPFSVENKLDNQDIICSREHFPWYKQETMLKQKKKKKKIGCMSDLDTWLNLRYVERRM